MPARSWLARMAGMPPSRFWLKIALILFFVIGVCWLPVLRLQLRARELPLPPTYFRVMCRWFWLGWPAFLSVLAIFWPMVKKPM